MGLTDNQLTCTHQWVYDTVGFIKNCPSCGHAHPPSCHPLYNTWKSMIRRCVNPKDRNYHNYGGRGIKVCDRWFDFRLFIVDMGIKPSDKHSIDRINNDGNYEPCNCWWATNFLQSINRHRAPIPLKVEDLLGTLPKLSCPNNTTKTTS